jgi:hypothetical protein
MSGLTRYTGTKSGIKFYSSELVGQMGRNPIRRLFPVRRRRQAVLAA